MLASEPAQALIGRIIEEDPDIGLLFGVPLGVIAGVVVVIIVIEMFGGKFFDFDVNIVYCSVFSKLEEMVAEMEELRAW